ncbi:MAG TPA: hypothetical protein DDY68_06575, partial [Porphyromonadaceae bacterium]|nr:hypothetical protein [Porphyromonadaceae bacterium]
MKRCIIFGSFIIGLFSECFANDLVQNVEKNTPVKDRSQWKEYSHWSIGANMGMPFMSAKTFSSLPEHSFWAGILGYSPGFQVTYQLNPYFGLTFNMDFNHIDMIPRRRVTEIDAVLQQNGMSREGKLGAPNANEEYLKNLVVINNYFTFGLGFDFNLVNMFSPNRYKPTRFAFILSPHVCLYAFNPTLYYEKEQSKEFKYSKPAIGPIVGLGASTRLLYRASKLVDVQMRIYSGWVFSNTADGVDCSALPEENQGIAKWNLHISAGVVFKLNGKNKRDN